jgi:hypothetical protein
MGTGSIGGGGAGGGSGAGSIGLGEYRFDGATLVSPVMSQDDIRKKVRSKLRSLSKDYVKKQFGSPLVRAVYEELFVFSRCAFSTTSKEKVQSQQLDLANSDEMVSASCAALCAEYKIDSGRGFLTNWKEMIRTKYEQSEFDQTVWGNVNLCLEDFLLKAVGDDLNLYHYGTCAQVIRGLRQNIFKSTSGYFLGQLIWRVLDRQYPRQDPGIALQLRRASQEVADRVIESFEMRFKGKGVGYRDLFGIIQSHPDWFREELRK